MGGAGDAVGEQGAADGEVGGRVGVESEVDRVRSGAEELHQQRGESGGDPALLTGGHRPVAELHGHVGVGAGGRVSADEQLVVLVAGEVHGGAFPDVAGAGAARRGEQLDDRLGEVVGDLPAPGRVRAQGRSHAGRASVLP